MKIKTVTLSSLIASDNEIEDATKRYGSISKDVADQIRHRHGALVNGLTPQPQQAPG